MFKKTILPNKLRILTAPMKGTNTVTVLVMCETGSDNEIEKERGISHFLEHMFFKGTKNRPNPSIIKHELDSMGSVSNAFTTHEFTGYFIKAGHVYADQALDLLSDIYKNSLLEKKEIDRERQVIVEEMHMYLDTPSRHVWELYEGLLYGNQNAGWAIIGTEKHIRGFTPEEFRDYFQRQYTSKNTVIIVAGNFDEKKMIEKVKKLFGNIRSGNPRPKGSFAESQSKEALLLSHKETDQTHITLGFRGLPAKHKDKYALDMLAVILGGGWSARMWDVVRDKLGLAYRVQTANDSYSNRGDLTTYAGVAHENTEKAIAAMMGEYRKIADKGVTVKELRRSKDYVKGRTLIGLETSDAVADFIASEEVMTGKPLTVQEVFKKIDAVTAQHIQAIAKMIIRSNRLNCTILGPHKDQKAFQKLITL